MKAAAKADGATYYSYVLAYVGNVLCLDTTPKQVIDTLLEPYKLKDRSFEASDAYLAVAEVKQFKIPKSDLPGKIRGAIQVCGKSCQGHQN
jgi:hypothetical protein